MYLGKVMKKFKLCIRKNLEENVYILCVLDNGELFDIWGFNDLSNLYKVKSIIEKDMK